jgi:arylsulfatase A-like enzyme
MMGYHTPNIDRIANEGMIFTDYYGEQSCRRADRRSSWGKASFARD